MPINSEKVSSSKYDYFSSDRVKHDLKGRAIRGATVTVISQVVTFAIQTIGTIILARQLTPDDFGLVTMVLTVSLLLGNFGVNGFTEAVIQSEYIEHRQISTLFWINVGVACILAMLFVAFSPFIVLFYKEPRLTPIIIAIAASNVIAGLSVQHIALLKRSMQFNKTSANDVVAAIISIFIPIVLAWWGWGYWALVAKWVLAPLVITIGAWIMCSWRPSLPSRHVGVEPLLKYAAHTYGNFIMSYLRRNIDKMLMGHYFGTQTLGYYDRAYHLSGMLPNQIITPLYSVAISTFSRLSNDPEKYRYNYLKVISLLAFVGFPLSAALTLISFDVILFVLGPQWSKAGQIFLAFSASIGVVIIYITHGWLHLSLGTPDRWFRWSIIELIVTTACFMIGIQFGPFGVAVAFSASFYLLLGPALWYAGRPIQLKMSAVLSNLWKYYLAAFISGLICWFILYVYGLTSNIYLKFHILNRMAVAFILCNALYLALILAVFRSKESIVELMSILREIIKKKSLAK